MHRRSPSLIKIGIGHSTVAGATMDPTVSACNTANRSPAADDLAARDDLYWDSTGSSQHAM